MAWCRQATSHYLIKCWPRSLSPYGITRPQWLNTLRLIQNDHHFSDDIFKSISLNENCCLLMKISLKFIPKVPINNIPSLAQIMAQRRPRKKPLSEPMMVNSQTLLCVTRPQWVNTPRYEQYHQHFTDIKKIFLIWLKFHLNVFLGIGPLENKSSPSEVAASCWAGKKQKYTPQITKVSGAIQLWHRVTMSHFVIFAKIWKCRLRNSVHFVAVSMCWMGPRLSPILVRISRLCLFGV